VILRGWHIDGFGVFRDSRSPPLEPGLTVLHGPNEAGKSTLLAFIRGVLFGFPDGRSKTRQPLYPPLHGGPPGGRLFIEHGGRTYTLARQGGRRNASPELTDADGTTLPEGALTQLLGGADATLFRNVFGFSLWELQGLETLTEEGVRDRIFSGAVAGAGRSARAAAKDLEAKATDLYRPHAGHTKNRVHHLHQELKQVEAELEAARAAARAYPEKRNAEAAAEAEVATRRETLRRLSDRKAELARRRDLWSAWTARDAALAELERLTGRAYPRAAAVAPDPDLDALAGRADKLRETLALQRERLKDVEHRDRAAVGEQARLDQALAELGPDWGAARVAAFGLDIPTRETLRAWETDLSEAGRRCEKAAEARASAESQTREAEEAVTGHKTELAALGDAPPTRETLRGRADALDDLEAREDDLDRLERDARAARAAVDQAGQRLADLTAETPGRLPEGLLAAALALLLGAAAAWQVLATPGLAGALGGLGVAAAVAGLRLWRARRRRVTRIAEARDARDAAEAEARRQAEAAQAARAAVTAAAQALDFEAPPDAATLAAARRALRAAQERRDAYDAKAKALAEAERTLARRRSLQADAVEAERTAREAQADLQARWRAWNAEAGFPEALSPQGVRDFAQQIAAAQDALAKRDEHQSAAQARRRDIADWETAARTILNARGDATLDAAGQPLTGEALLLAFETAAETLARERDQHREVQQTEQTLLREAGNDPDVAAALRADLAEGDPARWTAALNALESDLAEAQSAYDAAVGRLRDACNDRAAVERSERIAALELERNRLGAEIAACHARWRVLRAAHGLIQETLETYERERQPEVFRRASERLGFFSQGRYTQIRQDAEGQSFSVLDDAGRALRPLDLSRGTREQLYLAVRLGLIEVFMERGTVLPLVMDEVLVNFDPARMTAVLRELAQFAKGRQILMFTCHPEIAERARAAAPDSQVRALAEDAQA